MQINLYNSFSKRQNSTKSPTGTGTQADVVFKDGCSIEKPVFLINGVDLGVNYLWFNGRYYFVDDIVLGNNDIYELHCSIDVLATWRSYIGSYTGYIERSASSNDPYIYDYNIKAKRQIINPTYASTSISMYDSTGSYIFPVMNRYGVEIFCTTYIDDFGPLFFPGTYNLADFSTWLQTGISSMTNLTQYFGKVVWVPYAPSALDGTTVTAGSPISMGTISWTLSHDILKLNNTFVKTDLGTVRISKPTPYYNDFRDMSSDWCQYTLYIPGVGNVPLDPVIAGNPAIDLLPYIYFEPATGSVLYRILAVENYGTVQQTSSLLGVYKGDMSAVMPYGDSQFATKELGQNIIGGVSGTAAGIAAGNYVGAAVSAVSGVVGAAGTAFTGASATLYGGSGSFATSKYNQSYVLSQVPLAAADIPNSETGRPLCKIDMISNHAGYIKMVNAAVEIPGTGPEKDAVNSYLNSGFYYE